MVTKEAEEREHKRLRQFLNDEAQRLGYTVRLERLPDRTEPDALWLDQGNRLFMGDAKVEANQPPTDLESRKQLEGYLRQYGKLLGERRIQPGVVAVGTDTETAARAWAIAMNGLVQRVPLMATRVIRLRFDFEKRGPGTWLVSSRPHGFGPCSDAGGSGR